MTNKNLYISHIQQLLKHIIIKIILKKKDVPFREWKHINKDNYKSVIDINDKVIFIITGKLSNITVVDFDDKKLYNSYVENYPDLKNNYTVKTNKGYHIYFKYESSLKSTTNINNIKGIDIRNDGGLIIAPPTKYKLLSGQTARYKYVSGEILDIPKYLLDIFTPKKKEQKINKEQKQESNHNIITEICKLLSIIDGDRVNNYDDWIKIGIIIYNTIGGDNGLAIYHKFSKFSDKYDEDETNKKYDSFQSDRDIKLTIGTLKQMAKDDDIEEYNKLYTCNEPIKSTFTMLEKDIAEYVICNLLKNSFINTMPKPGQDFYYFNKNTWVRDKGGSNILHIIYNDLVKEYETFIISSTNEDEKEIANKLIKKLKGKLCYINSIIDWIAILTYNSVFFDIVDENPDLIAFENGTYEINNKIFREGRKEDYITKTVGYNFPIEEDYGHKKDIENFLIQVFPNEEVRKFVIQTQAQALCGRKTEDLIYTHTGRGGNGKSILIEILTNVFGDYFVNIPVGMLTQANNKGHNDPDPYMSKLKGVRYAMSNEPKDGASFNDALIKNLGSQETLQYRMLYSNDVIPLKIQLKMNIYCNNKLKFNGEDKGVARRMCVIDYISRFDTIEDEVNNVYKIDTSLTDKVKSWKQDYMRMLISLYQVEYKHSPPKSIIDASKMYIDDNNDVLKFVGEYYEKTNNNDHFILLKDIKIFYQSNKQYEQTKLKSLKESLEKIFNTNFIEDKKIKGKKYRSVIMGWKKRSDDEEKEEINALDRL